MPIVAQKPKNSLTNEFKDQYVEQQLKVQNKHNNAVDFLKHNKTNRAQAKEELQKQHAGFLKLLVETVKNQATRALCSDSGSDGNAMDSALQVAESGLRTAQGDEMIDSLDELAADFKNSRISNFLGKRIDYDNSIRTYNGEAITFDYEVKNPQNASNVRINVQVLDEDGRMVYRGSGTSNELKWDGRDNQGKEVAKKGKKYRIVVSAKGRVGEVILPLTVETVQTGMVGAIGYSPNGEAQLEVNGRLIEHSNVRKVYDSSRDDKFQLTAKDCVNYVGERVSVDLSKINVDNGKGEITYYNTVEQYPEGSKLVIKLYDLKGKLVKEMERKTKLAVGFGKLSFDPAKEKIANGDYRCTISVEERSAEEEVAGKLIELTSKRSLEIAGINFATQEIISDAGEKYSLKQIVEIGGHTSTEQSLINKGMYYIGSSVEYKKDKFKYNNAPFSLDFKVPRPPAGKTLGDAVLEIYRGDKLVASVAKPAADLYHQEVEQIPTFAELDAASSARVKSLVREQHGADYDLLSPDEQNNFARPIIRKGFRAGMLFKIGHLAEEDKRRNMGNVNIAWNGIENRNDNKAAMEGAEYRYTLRTSVLTDATGELVISPLDSIDVQLVRETEVRNGTLYLRLADANRTEISVDEVTAVRK